MHVYFVYLIVCSDGTFYVGVTNNVVRRFQEHCDAIDPRSYTAKRRPLKLVYVEPFQWILDAIAPREAAQRLVSPEETSVDHAGRGHSA